MLRLIFILLSLSFLLFSGCTTSDDIKPVSKPWVFNTKPVLGVGGYKATSGGDVLSQGSDPIVRKGVCWTRNNQVPSINLSQGFVTENGNSKESWFSNIEGFAPRDCVMVRSYVQTKNATFYGNVLKYFVSIEPEPPVVGTNPPSDLYVWRTAAKISGKISTDGGSDIIERGFAVLNTSTNTLLPLVKMPLDSLKEFDTILSKLTTNTTYRVQAYARSRSFQSPTYGDEFFFSTSSLKSDPVPVVSTLNSRIQNISGEQSVFASGSITPTTNGLKVYSRGICYVISPDPLTQPAPVPTVDDQVASDSITNSSAFEIKLTGLLPNKKYYYRAFARNAAGFGYGEVKSFTAP